jgi:hypothetical protein
MTASPTSAADLKFLHHLQQLIALQGWHRIRPDTGGAGFSLSI